MDTVEVLIVIPAYNESNRINKFEFLDYLKKHPNTNFLFVDDGSTDDTNIVLTELSQNNPSQINVLKLPKNLGKGNAVREGYLWAKKTYHFNYFGFIDSDLTIPLEVISNLYDTLKESNYNLSIASRFKDVSKLNTKASVFRKILSFFNKKITDWMFNGVVSDTQCGCKLFKKNILPIAFTKSFISSWLFDIEIFLRLKKKNQFLVYEYQLTKLNANKDSRFRKRDLFLVFIKLNSIIFNYYIKKPK